ncbi:hypothetical protein P8452_62863 [Trifolium repens]|nr:hypothetical protein P8452_62863 [Trifolium repens]
MTRRPFEKIKDIDDTKSLWKIAVRVKDLWVVRHGKTNNQHFEMVVCDELGDEIQVTVPSDLNDKFKTQFTLHQTCTLQNFSVEHNKFSIKATPHSFKLIITAGTLIEDVNQHKIAAPGYKFKDFSDITNGKVPSDLLIDVIGNFHELGYTQLVPGGRKLQVNFKLKDLTGNILNVTLWEDFALQFSNYNKRRTDWGPTIVLIHNAKIKEATDAYELGISNVWNGTQLFINADLPDIIQFKSGLNVDEGSASQSQQLSSQSQMLTQSTSLTQHSSGDRFLNNALILPLSEVLKLTEPTICLTVVNTLKINPSKFGWYYKLCSQCPRAAKGASLPLRCDKDHETHVINLRYKLDLDVEYQGVKTVFVFWDRECNELIGKTAADLHAEMVEAGVTNPLEYPLDVDNCTRRKLACRIKLQPNFNNYSVQAVKVDEEVIKKIEAQFPINEETFKLANAPTPEVQDDTMDLPVQSEDVQVGLETQDIIMPTELSASSEHDPNDLPATPAKQSSMSPLEKNVAATPSKSDSQTPPKRHKSTIEIPEEVLNANCPTQQSSSKPTLTKLRSIIKKEKCP